MSELRVVWRISLILFDLLTHFRLLMPMQTQISTLHYCSQQSIVASLVACSSTNTPSHIVFLVLPIRPSYSPQLHYVRSTIIYMRYILRLSGEQCVFMISRDFVTIYSYAA